MWLTLKIILTRRVVDGLAKYFMWSSQESVILYIVFISDHGIQHVYTQMCSDVPVLLENWTLSCLHWTWFWLWRDLLGSHTHMGVVFIAMRKKNFDRTQKNGKRLTQRKENDFNTWYLTIWFLLFLFSS